jgi:chemotaxis methyl-accepting protein methylase
MSVPSQFLHKLVNQKVIKKGLTTFRLFVRLYFNLTYLRKDPYQLSRTEEVQKFQKAFHLLPGNQFNEVLEIGCGEGKTTAYLVPIAKKITAIDISDIAIQRAKRQNYPNVIFKQADFFTEQISESFDLIFCSEVLCYFEPEQLPQVVERISQQLKPTGLLLLIHHRSIKDDSSGLDLKEIGAKTVHGLFIEHDEFALQEDITEPMYRISILQRM